MIGDYDIIRQLYIEKLSDLISVEDEARLLALIEKDVENSFFYKSLVKEGEALAVNDFIENLNSPQELFLQKQSKRKQKRYQWFSSAAAILVILSLAIWYWSPKQQVEQYVSETAAFKDNGQVQLSVDGETVDLNQKEDSKISIGNLTLSTSGNAIKSITGTSSATLNTLIVPAKLDYQITLPDGTKIHLNSVSKLQFPSQFSGNTREIFLEGEAFLEVAKNKNKPFIVHTTKADIKVLGTSFNVNTYETGHIKTALVEGAVQLTSKNGSQLNLSPGYEASFNDRSGFIKTPFDDEQVLAWTKGVYYFHDVSVKELEPLISRWFDMKVVFENEKYNNFTISGLLEKGELNSFLKDLTATSDIKYQVIGKEIKFR